MSRLLAAVLAASVGLSGCTHPQVTVAPEQQAVKTVAVMPFDNRSGAREPIGETATDLFTRDLMRSGRYKVIGGEVAERTVRIESTVDPSKGESEKVEVTATEKGANPIDWARKVGADAVVTGAVTKYRHRQAFIFPPAEVAIEAKLVHVQSREVLWSASHTQNYGVWRWLTFFVWPVGVLLAFFSPPADARLRQASSRVADAVERRLASRP